MYGIVHLWVLNHLMLENIVFIIASLFVFEITLPWGDDCFYSKEDRGKKANLRNCLRHWNPELVLSAATVFFYQKADGERETIHCILCIQQSFRIPIQILYISLPLAPRTNYTFASTLLQYVVGIPQLSSLRVTFEITAVALKFEQKEIKEIAGGFAVLT